MNRLFIPACRFAVAVAFAWYGAAAAVASNIYGTMSNFDVFNDTSTDVYGAEIELEDVHSIDITRTFPSHFDTKSVEEYSSGATFGGTRIIYSGYNFKPSGFLAPTVGQSTNGHFCVNVSGCEHFGFSARSQPTATRFYWLDRNLQRIDPMPAPIPNPTWAYVPPANPGGAAMLRAEVEVPEPAEVHEQKPDSIWMKVYKTELERRVDLDELMSGGGVVPEDESETETEWELLEGGKIKAAEGEVGENGKSIVRRYEYYKYTGPYDNEHEPTSLFLDEDMDAPPPGELGDFISANMVAANLAPEPGDLNEDGAVDRSDVARWISSFGQSGEGPLRGDVDGDGFVALRDLAILQSRLSEGIALARDVPPPGAIGAAAAVPEPSSLACAAIGLMALAPLARRFLRSRRPV
ncbi:MAG: hypothetical protein DCC68_22730 [Planctomycetota bacterium]|nr:MAG: hypothetical protein DCC68_22730 [Planctomycetota bacterium]